MRNWLGARWLLQRVVAVVEAAKEVTATVRVLIVVTTVADPRVTTPSQTAAKQFARVPRRIPILITTVTVTAVALIVVPRLVWTVLARTAFATAIFSIFANIDWYVVIVFAGHFGPAFDLGLAWTVVDWLAFAICVFCPHCRLNDTMSVNATVSALSRDSSPLAPTDVRTTSILATCSSLFALSDFFVWLAVRAVPTGAASSVVGRTAGDLALSVPWVLTASGQRQYGNDG